MSSRVRETLKGKKKNINKCSGRTERNRPAANVTTADSSLRGFGFATVLGAIDASRTFLITPLSGWRLHQKFPTVAIIFRESLSLSQSFSPIDITRNSIASQWINMYQQLIEYVQSNLDNNQLNWKLHNFASKFPPKSPTSAVHTLPTCRFVRICCFTNF